MLKVEFSLVCLVSLLVGQALSTSCWGQAPVNMKCATIVSTTCKDLYGDFPSSIGACDTVTCVNDDYCVIGEPKVMYQSPFFKNLYDNYAFNKTTEASPAATGARYHNVAETTCLTQTVCAYECFFKEGVGNRCKAMGPVNYLKMNYSQTPLPERCPLIATGGD